MFNYFTFRSIPLSPGFLFRVDRMDIDVLGMLAAEHVMGDIAEPRESRSCARSFRCASLRHYHIVRAATGALLLQDAM